MFIAFRMNKLRLSLISVILAAAVCLLGTAISEVTAVPQETAVHNECEPVILPVIMYHGLIKDKKYQNEYMIDPEFFEQDLRYLSENGYHTVVIGDLLQYFDSGKPLPEKPIMLTFDDGYYNNYTYAYPLLQKYECKAVISPIGIEANRAAEAAQAENRSPIYSQCNWDELKEMCDSGLVELQNHTYDLHHNDNGRQGAKQRAGEDIKVYREMLTEDLSKANDAIKTHTGNLPLCFTCPFGAKSEEMLTLVKELGFRAMMDCEEKTNYLQSADDLYSLHRYLRPNNLSAEIFFSELNIETENL